MAKATIVLTAAGGAMVPLAIRQLHQSRRHNVRVVAVDNRAGVASTALADAFHVVPAGNAPSYADTMLRIAAQESKAMESKALVLPWSDEEALALAPRRKDFEAAGAILLCTSAANLAIMSNKAKTFTLLGEHGIPVPRWYRAETLPELQAHLGRLLSDHGAAAVKPERSRGGRNVYVVRPYSQARFDIGAGREVHITPDEFSAIPDETKEKLLPALVMERLVPPGYDIDILCRHGKVLRSVPRRRVNPAGIPFAGGVILDEAPLHDLAKRVAATLSLDWLYDIDIFTTLSGELRVIETNPRPSGSLPATIAAGIDLWDDLISLAGGEHLEPQNPIGTRLVLPYTDVVVTQDPKLISELGK